MKRPIRIIEDDPEYAAYKARLKFLRENKARKTPTDPEVLAHIERLKKENHT